MYRYMVRGQIKHFGKIYLNNNHCFKLTDILTFAFYLGFIMVLL